jgi:ankyrin repeat protein
MDYRKRDKGFQRLVYTQLIASCYNLIALAQRNLDAEEPQIEPSSTSSETLHDASDAIATESNQSELWQTSIYCLFGPSGGLIHIDDDVINKEAILAYQVCACHWLELGTQLDDREIVRWAYMAAIGGHPQALWKAPLLEASCEYKIGSQQLRLSCLVLGAFIGSKPSLETLRLLNRPLYDSTRKAIQQRYRPDFKMGNALSLFIVWARSPHLNANECVLLDLLKTYNAELARDLLQDSSLILSDLTDQRGRNALHALTFLEDAEVDGLATACYMHKASLIHHAEELEVTTVYFNRQKIEGPPIQWAVTKGMTRLTRELLLLHDKHSVPITATMDLATQAATFHHYEILKMILDQQKTTPKLFSQRARLRLDGDNWGPFLHLLLNLALTRHDTFPLSRRLLLGANFAEARIATIRLLLEEGAAPFNTSAIVFTNGQQLSSGSSVVSVLLETDDAVSLSLLLSKIRQYPNEAAYPDSFATSLQYCIIGNRTKCFKLLLEEFPEFINHVGSLKTLTPLNVAARNHDPIYARMLLEKGADPTIFHQNFSPLTRAVIDGHLQTANVIYEALSEEQRELDFGFDKVTGFTMMGRVMSVWITRTKNQGLIHAIQWIHARGGAFLVSNNIKHFPIWLQILSRRTSHSQEHIMLDDRMLEVLFDMFPKMLDTPDPLGMFPIHWASFNGHLGAIVLLLQRNVNINAEATGHGQLKGVTAFSAVVNRLRMNPPEDIADGGKVEIRRWRQRLEQTLHHLRSNGATIGKNPSNLDAWRSLQYTVPNCSVSGIDEQDKDDELEWKKDTWPRKLPKDKSSSKLNQLNGGELIDPLAKRAIQTLLAPLKADLQEKPQVDENDREAFKEYGKWLSQEITYRRNQLKDQGYLLDDEDTRGFQYDWYKWHEPSASAWDQQAPMSSTSS